MKTMKTNILDQGADLMPAFDDGISCIIRLKTSTPKLREGMVSGLKRLGIWKEYDDDNK